VQSAEPYADALASARASATRTDAALLSCGVTSALDAGGAAWTLEHARASRAPAAHAPPAPTLVACGCVLTNELPAALAAALQPLAAELRPIAQVGSEAEAAALIASARAAGAAFVSVRLSDEIARPAAAAAESRESEAAERGGGGGAGGGAGGAAPPMPAAPRPSHQALPQALSHEAFLRAVSRAAASAALPLALVAPRLAGAALAVSRGRVRVLLHGVEDEQLDGLPGTLLEGLQAAEPRAGYCAALSLVACAEHIFFRRGQGAPGPAAAPAHQPPPPPTTTRQPAHTPSDEAGEPLPDGPALERRHALFARLGALAPNPRARGAMGAPFEARFAARRHVGRLNLLRAHMAGVAVLVGSGAGAPLAVHGLAVFDEMEAMQRAGLRPLEVLRAATSNGCDAIGLGAERGRVEAGLRADLLVLRADPSDNIEHMRSLQLVLKDGRLAWVRPGSRLERAVTQGAVAPGGSSNI
jgi:hypothetical protein